MKRFLALLLSLLLTLALVGCNSTSMGVVAGQDNGSPVDATNSAQSQAETQAVTEAPTDAVTQATEAVTEKPADSKISEEKAKSIALEHAGLKESEVKFLHVELDYDDGVLRYEVDFRQGNYEYDYDIDANTGKILSYDKDIDD